MTTTKLRIVINAAIAVRALTNRLTSSTMGFTRSSNECKYFEIIQTNSLVFFELT